MMKDLFDSFEKLQIKSALGLSMLFFSVLAPGFLVVFMFKDDAFYSLDVIKLIILSVAIASPGVLIPFFISLISYAVLKNNHPTANITNLGSPLSWYLSHAFSNAVNMYLIIFICYIFSLSFKVFLWMFFVSILLMVVFDIYAMLKRAWSSDRPVTIEVPGS